MATEDREAADVLAAGAAELGLRLPPSGVDRLLAFLADLRRWNRAYNLVADAPPLAWVRTHLLDSLAIAAPLRVLAVQAGHLAASSPDAPSRAGSPRSLGRAGPSSAGKPPGAAPPADPFRVLDLGSGAGLPGIPLAIALPELRFVLLDGNGKKVGFCRHAVTALGLPNVEAVRGRAERYLPSVPFDAAVVRAVGSLARILDLVRPCCQGPILAMKGRYPDRELEALRGVPVETVRVRVPGLEAERHLVVLRRPGNPAIG